MYKFIVKIQNDGYNSKARSNFLLSLKKSNVIEAFDRGKITRIIQERYIGEDSRLNGKLFFVQELGARLGEVKKIGRVFL